MLQKNDEKQMKTYFFQCSKCKNWRYTTSTRQYCKCLKCGHSINIKNIKKIEYNITISQAPFVLKELKKIKSEEKNKPVGFYSLRIKKNDKKQ